MTATVARLRNLNVAALDVAAHGWRRQAQRLGECEDAAVLEVTGPLSRSGWLGQAAAQAAHDIGWLDDRLRLAASSASLIARTLEMAAARWRVIQDRLRQLFEDAVSHGLLVDDDGVRLPAADPRLVPLDEYHAQRQRLALAGALLRRRVAELLEAAETLDAEVANVLGRLQPFSPGPGGDTAHELRDLVGDARAVAAFAGYGQAGLPAPGGDPRHAAQWWRSVDPADHAMLLLAFPHHLGSLDGLPAGDRDTANRAHLDSCLTGGQGGNPDAVRKLRDTLEAADHDRPGQLLLLGFDGERDGRAIVAVGNPDHAAHTAVMVPGVNTDLDDMPGQISRAADLRFAADNLTPAPGDVSVIAWLGYDAPDNSTALGWERAREGGPALDAFVNGLHAAHDPSPSHVTAIGHSYGSTVVGEAASRGDGRGVGDIVVAGSPGMHVEGAAGLNLDPHHVWAGHAQGDPISGELGSLPGVHGDQPTDQAFGANRFHVDTTGHSSYWQQGSTGLHNQAAIVVGRYDLVTLEHGTVPR